MFPLWEVKLCQATTTTEVIPNVCTKMVPTTKFIYGMYTYLHAWQFFFLVIYCYKLYHTCIVWAILVVLHISIFSTTAHAFWILKLRSFWINKQLTISRPAELPCRSCRSSACSNATSTGGKQHEDLPKGVTGTMAENYGGGSLLGVIPIHGGSTFKVVYKQSCIYKWLFLGSS